jgi:prevent-host-death family protein
MKTVGISAFKANCSALIARAQRTKKPIRITRFGKPVADVVPIPPIRKKGWMGSMKAQIEIRGDILSPASEESDWEALR